MPGPTRSACDHGQVNLLVSSAGVARAGTVRDSSYEDCERLMTINFWGVIYGTKAFLPCLEASEEGHISRISSIFGLFAPPGMGAYSASQFAVRGFTESLRQELGLQRNGISATCVHPGGVRTSIHNAGHVSSSTLAVTGSTEAETRRNVERLFMTTPEAAAREILEGVQKSARRVLIGGRPCRRRRAAPPAQPLPEPAGRRHEAGA